MEPGRPFIRKELLTQPESDVRHPLVVAALAAVLIAPAATAQTATDSAGIRRAALDYVEGWYAGDGAMTAKALHPDLAKRIVRSAPDGVPRVDHMTSEQLVALVSGGGGRSTPPAQRRADVAILDIFRGTASVRLDAQAWVDYLHIAKVGTEWKIINVLWEMRTQD